MGIFAGGLLDGGTVSASAPCRVDAGGTWDIKAMALPFETAGPVTVNVALDLRTTVRVGPHRDGWVRVSSSGFEEGIDVREGRFPLEPPFGAYFGAVAHFGFHGLALHIDSASPVKSALGGSSAALVALIRALAFIGERVGTGAAYSRRRILHLAYHLEDALQGGCGGMQDQAAAVYGGVNRWEWTYSRPGRPYTQTGLLDRSGRSDLGARMLVAFSGRCHVSVDTNRKWIRDFLGGRTREGWLAVNAEVRRFAEAVQDRNWEAAARSLQREMALRREITPEALIQETEALISAAETCGCGARFAGAGAGGSLWALGSIDCLQRLRTRWSEMLGRMEGARLLQCRVDASGVRLD